MFDQEKYKRTGWKAVLANLEQDNYQDRLIVRVATGRKYWPLFSTPVSFELGKKDPAIDTMKNSLCMYTHPMIDRFVNELETMLTDLYKIEIKLK